MGFDIAVCVAAGVVSFVVALLVRASAQRLGLIQAPNARSSHTLPTPSGGGLGIVAGGTLGSLALIAPAQPLLIVPLAASVAIAGIGFYDDRRPLPALRRLLIQMLLVAVTIFAAIPIVALQSGSGLPLPEILIVALAVVGAVYWTNIFNFMDGIDGIAASEAIFILAAAAWLAFLHGHEVIGSPLWWGLIVIAAASLGFLLLNWPPAKIFMGDAGSTYLGFMLAVFAMLTIAEGWLSTTQWAILVAVFVTDATVTVVRRVLRGERIYEAHRLHAYQHLSRRWRGHLPVTLTTIAVNVVWLLPLAWLAGNAQLAWPALGLAYIPLIALMLLAGAGTPEKPLLSASPR